MTRLSHLVAAAAFASGLSSLDDLRGQRRFRHLTEARGIYALLARRAGYSWGSIGHEINKDHSTMWCAHQVAQARLLVDEQFATRVKNAAKGVGLE